MEKELEKPLAMEKAEAAQRRGPLLVNWAARIAAIVTVLYLHFNSTTIFSKVSPKDSADPVAAILDTLKDNLAGNWSAKYTAEAHLAGTNYGLVEWTRSKFEEYGWETEVDTYDILVSYPESHALHLLHNGTVAYTAPLKEDALEEDPTTQGDDGVPTFLGYAANGNVTAQYVYVNYGTREDFALLAEWGVDVAGKIAVARYGNIFRGLKVKFAQEHGAAGVLLYTDPGDDGGITPANGYKQYPHGPARHELAVQRGSVQFLGGLGATPGDPTTPGYASKGDVERKDPHGSIGRIPVLPVSYREVAPILHQLNGQGKRAPAAWRGELEGYDYHVGPAAHAELNLYSNQVYNITPLWNVYGEIAGENADEVIVIGNHRDAWIKGGAGDPNSGSAALIEVARALGALKKAGFKFKRTIVLQSYDGEEYGLLGLTEFGEYAAKRLQRTVVAYLNMDVAVVGRYLGLGASPVLKHVLRKVAKWLPYPEKHVGTLYDHLVTERGDRIANLGSGLDYTVFLEHLGIPAADLGFGQGKGDAIYQYHLSYDLYHWMTHYGDKDFVYHNLAAKYLALLAYDLAQHEVIDFSVKDYADDVLAYYKEIAKEIPKGWFAQPVDGRVAESYLADDGNEEYVSGASNSYYRYARAYFFPELLTPRRCQHDRRMKMYHNAHHRNLTFGDLYAHTQGELERLVAVAETFDLESAALQAQHEHRADLHWWLRIRLHFKIVRHNKLLQYFERNFLHHRGLDGREWFKHIVFALGRYTGYAGQTWPGIREAVEDRNLDAAVRWLGVAARAVKRVASALE